MYWLALTLVVLSIPIGMALTLFMLPGVWFVLLVGAVVNWLVAPEMFSWWTIGVAAGIALIGEALEFGAGAVGASAAGSTKTGAVGALVGAMVGAVGGTMLIPVPIVGTVVGGIVGAGVGALAAERGLKGRTWKDSAVAGTGAAVGRGVATVVKIGVAGGVCIILFVAAVV